MRSLLIIPLCLAGCGQLPEASSSGAKSADPSDSIVVDPGADGQAEATSEEEEASSTQAVGPLGRTVASLGNASEPGLWLKTPLVANKGPGRVTYPMTGRSTAVTLIPIEGPATAGSRLSLQAMQALGASLTDLPEIEVSAGA